MKIAGKQHRYCHSERAKRVEESKVLDFSIAWKSPCPHPWIPACNQMTVALSLAKLCRGSGEETDEDLVGQKTSLLRQTQHTAGVLKEALAD